MHKSRLEYFREYLKEDQHLKDILFLVFVLSAAVLVLAAVLIGDSIDNQIIRNNAVSFYDTYLADEEMLDEYEAITVVFQDEKRNYYVFTYTCDPIKLYDCKDNYGRSYNGEMFGYVQIPGCRYKADDLLKLTCGDKVDTTDISDAIFGTDTKPKNVACIIAGELKASLKKEISLSL